MRASEDGFLHVRADAWRGSVCRILEDGAGRVCAENPWLSAQGLDRCSSSWAAMDFRMSEASVGAGDAEGDGPGEPMAKT
jgi:hypothetical protein